MAKKTQRQNPRKTQDDAPKDYRCYARNASDERRLLALGADPRRIYREDRHGEGWGEWHLRPGEFLMVVDGLKALGTARRDIERRVDEVMAWGAHCIVDPETHLRTDRDGVKMMSQALAKITDERARELQSKAARSRVKGRMSDTAAKAHWFDGALSVNDALELMTGWTMRTAYNRFGPRNLGAGRKRKK